MCIISVYANVTGKGFAWTGNSTPKFCLFSSHTIKKRKLAPYLAQTVDLASAFASHNRDLCQRPKRKPIFRIGSNFR